MIARNGGLFVPSIRLKIAFIFLFVGFILHVVGFSIARWGYFTLGIEREDLLITVNIGLWKQCHCIFKGSELCSCIVNHREEPEWFGAVQAMEVLGLIGYLSTGITCLTLLRYRQTMALKQFNIFFTLCSGVTIIIGLIIFGTEFKKGFYKMSEILDVIDKIEASERLSTSFVVCSVAAGIALSPCLFLFVMDIRTEMASVTDRQQQTISMPVQSYGQVASASFNEVQVIENVVNQQQATSDISESERTAAFCKNEDSR